MDSATIQQNELSEDVVLEFECEIEEDVKAELDDFVRLSHMGQFKDAHELYDECLSSYDDWFPVAAEYADCCLHEGNFEQLAAFCEKASRKFQDPREYVLLELIGGIGSLLPRDAMARRLKDLWPVLASKLPFSSLRDTDIHLLEIILQILVFSKLDPEDLPVVFHSAGLWDLFKDWFYFLLRRHYFWEAYRISQSLFYVLPRLECQDLVQDHITEALSANIDQDSVKIAVSSMVQHFIYAFKSTHPSVLAVVQWNDAITWALFGVTLKKAGEDSTSLFSRLCLRRSLELELNISLPLDGGNEDDGLSDLLHEAAMYGDTAVLEVLTTLPNPCTLDELNRRAFSHASLLYSHKILPFLDPENVNAQDGYRRTPLHWASLMGEDNVVETLLSVGKADAGLIDWFGCTPLHYALNPYISDTGVPGSGSERLRIVKALLLSEPASVNTRDLNGQTPLNMAIVQQTYEVAEVLLENEAKIETRDYGALLLIGGNNIDWLSSWKGLLSKYDHSKPSVLGKCEEFEVPALRFQKASLYHPGTIDLNTHAASLLRALDPSYIDEFLPPLRSLLECEFSIYELPTSSQVHDTLHDSEYTTHTIHLNHNSQQQLQQLQATTDTYPTLLNSGFTIQTNRS